MTVLITRPAEDGAPLARLLAERGYASLLEPLMSVVRESGAGIGTADCQAVLLTSANGARALADATDQRDIRLLAVGDATARTALSLGFANVESAGGDVDDLVRLVESRLVPEAGPLQHVAGRFVAGDLAGRLTSAGFTVRTAKLYVAQPVTALSAAATDAFRRGEIDAVLLFSPRTGTAFSRLVAEAGIEGYLGRSVAVCLSDAVRCQIDALGWKECAVATVPTQQALIERLTEVCPPQP